MCISLFIVDACSFAKHGLTVSMCMVYNCAVDVIAYDNHASE